MKKDGGYVGFALLLVTIGIIAFMMWRSDLFTGGVKLELDESGNPVKTFDTQINAIQKAKDAKAMIEAEAQSE